MTTSLAPTPDPLEPHEIGLQALALYADNPRRAAKALKDAGQDITKDQLEKWRSDHPDRYDAIRADVQSKVMSRLAATAENVASNAYEAMDMAIDQTRQKLVHGSVRDPSSTAANLAKTAQLATQQAALMRGQPTAIVETRSADEILKSLAGKLSIKPAPKADADTTAEDVTE